MVVHISLARDDLAEPDDGDWSRRAAIGGDGSTAAVPFPGWWLILDPDFDVATLSPVLASDLGVAIRGASG